MNLLRRLSPFAIAACLCPPVAIAHEEIAEGMAEAATAFLASLDKAELGRAQFALDDAERTNWHYVPYDRKGLPFGEMDSEQWHLANDLLRSALSAEGFQKAKDIQHLEALLAAMEDDSERRNHRNYFFAIFGDPDADGTWAWRFEGHHLSMNWAINDGTAVASTPSFLGANPGVISGGVRDGHRALAEEEDLARAFLHGLDEGQRAKAIISDKAPKDILTKEQPTADQLKSEGIAFADLTAPQKAELFELIAVYMGRGRAEQAAEDLAEAKDEGGITFAWAGGIEPGEGHYYRIMGATFLIEYDNVQDGAQHPHAVWRDYDEDFGGDPLRDHIREAHGE